MRAALTALAVVSALSVAHAFVLSSSQLRGSPGTASSLHDLAASAANTVSDMPAMTSLASPAGSGGIVSVAAFGGGGVYRTTTGWTTWVKVLDANVNKLGFVSSMVGYAAGDGVYRTTDGGATWSQVFAPVNTTFIALAACSETHVVVSGIHVAATGAATLSATTTDGTTWVSSPLSQFAGFLDLTPTASNPMAVIGIEMYFEKAANIPEATVLTSMDCGATWTSDYNFSRPLPTNFFLQNAFDLSGFWQSPTQGVLTGWFREVEIPNSAKAQSCSLGAAQPSPSPALFAGTANKTTGSGALLFAQDDATAFKTVQPPTQPATLDSTCGTTLYDGAYVGSSNASIFVVGGSFFYIKPVGFVLRSDDGGATWTNVFNTKMVDLHGVAFGPSGMHGCVIGFYTGGEHGTARYASVGCSSDGGATWSMADTLFAFPKPTTQGLWEAVDIAVLS